jgi:3-phosphoshikimate 1-carboxyvinyltransferase
MKLEVGRAASLRGDMRAPSDKSITHRAYMIGAIAKGQSVIRNPLRGEDCESTLRCLWQMGLEGEWLSPTEVRLTPASEWVQPSGELFCGNSGTTMRLLSGLIASRRLDCTLTGDASLSKRPMKRIAEPLTFMGAKVEGDTAPIHIQGRNDLAGINYKTPVASAQIKSCVLLAGLGASGTTTVSEPARTRDHTERMLTATGVNVGLSMRGTSVTGGSQPFAFELTVPGDLSSAAFFMVAAALLPDSELLIGDLGANPLRAGIFEIFADAGIPFWLDDERLELGEPLKNVRVSTAPSPRSFRIEGDLVPRLVDEIPILAVLATQCDGTTEIRDAKELRVKESDRVQLMATGLRSMGANVETFEDGMAIQGPVKLKGMPIDAQGDHRVAMAFAVAGLIAEGKTEIEGAESIQTSFPEFEKELWRLCIV